jgi:hypothetical protein
MRQPHAKRPRRASLQSQIETSGEAMSCACGPWLSRLSDAWSLPWRADRQAQRELSACHGTNEAQ